MGWFLKVKEGFGIKYAKIVAIIIVAFFAVYYHNHILEILKILLKRIKEYPLALFFIAICIMFNYLFKKSDKLSNEEMEEYYTQRTEYKKDYHSKSYVGISFVASERGKTGSREIVLRVNNESLAPLEYINGNMNLYKRDPEYKCCKIGEIPFEYGKLKGNTRGAITKIELTDDIRFWDEFDIHIKNMKHDEKEEEVDIDLSGCRFIRNHGWIFRYYDMYDNRVLGIRTKYNLCWLKNELKKIGIFIRFHCRQQVYFFGVPSKEKMRELRKEQRRKWFIRLLVVLLGVGVSGLIIVSFLQFFKFSFFSLYEIGTYITKWLDIKLPAQ